MTSPVQMIYFPSSYESKKVPYVIFSTGEEFVGECRDTPYLEEFRQGKFAWYEVSKCRPYSKALWKSCLKWIEDKGKLEKRYQEFMKKGRKKK